MVDLHEVLIKVVSAERFVVAAAMAVVVKNNRERSNKREVDFAMISDAERLSGFLGGLKWDSEK